MPKLRIARLALLVAAMVALASAPNASAVAKEKCITIGEKRICFDDGKGKKSNDNGGNGDATDESNKPQPTGNKCQGEIACPPGYVVLDKPNKYGACCEPKDGVPAPASTEKCKFPGEVGTPPNCHCPGGTEFIGYKGCVKVEMKEKCVVYFSGRTQDEDNRLDKEWEQIRTSCPKDATQAGCIGGTCCCKYKVYAN